jgi:hypothetical protein
MSDNTLELFFEGIEDDFAELDKIEKLIVGTPGTTLLSNIASKLDRLYAKWSRLINNLQIDNRLTGIQGLQAVEELRRAIKKWRRTEQDKYSRDVVLLSSISNEDDLDLEELIQEGGNEFDAGIISAAERLLKQKSTWESVFMNINWSTEMDKAAELTKYIKQALDKARVELVLIAPETKLPGWAGLQRMVTMSDMRKMITAPAVPGTSVVMRRGADTSGHVEVRTATNAAETTGPVAYPGVGEPVINLIQHGGAATVGAAAASDVTVATFAAGGYSILVSAEKITGGTGLYMALDNDTVASTAIAPEAGASNNIRFTCPDGAVHNLDLSNTASTFLMHVPSGGGSLTYTFVASDYFSAATSAAANCRAVSLHLHDVTAYGDSAINVLGNTGASAGPSAISELIGTGAGSFPAPDAIKTLFKYIRLYDTFQGKKGTRLMSSLETYFDDMKEETDPADLPESILSLDWFFSQSTSISKSTKSELYEALYKRLDNWISIMSNDTKFHRFLMKSYL